MKKAIKLLFAGALVAAAFIPAQAQKLHGSLNLQNEHLWRGIEVNNGFVTCTDLSISDNADHFRFGVWGGYKLGRNDDKPYKEFDYYMQYTYGGFKIALWDFNNYSDAPNSDIFCYRNNKTNHFLDLQLAYTLPVEAFPLTLGWSTVLWGNDKFYDTNDKKMKNVYSSYISADAPIWHKGRWTVFAGVGCGFALSPAEGTDDAHKYGEGFSCVQANLGATYDLKVTDKYHIPVTVNAWFNPDASKGHLQIDLGVLSF